MDDLGYRNMWISLGVGLTATGIGMVLLRHTGDARAAFGLLCMVLTIILRHVLDGRELRRREKE
jgi:hypothetical protein